MMSIKSSTSRALSNNTYLAIDRRSRWRCADRRASSRQTTSERQRRWSARHTDWDVLQAGRQPVDTSLLVSSSVVTVIQSLKLRRWRIRIGRVHILELDNMLFAKCIIIYFVLTGCGQPAREAFRQSSHGLGEFSLRKMKMMMIMA